MGRLIHFEIHVDDMERAKKFYGEVFGWSFQDWSDYAGMPYFGAVTGDENEPGINGALMQRQSAPPEINQSDTRETGGVTTSREHGSGLHLRQRRRYD